MSFNLVRSQLNERLALVQLYQALGGRWRQEVKGTEMFKVYVDCPQVGLQALGKLNADD
jgi:hypothetical protein